MSHFDSNEASRASKADISKKVSWLSSCMLGLHAIGLLASLFLILVVLSKLHSFTLPTFSPQHRILKDSSEFL